MRIKMWLTALALLIGGTTTALAYGQWETATNTGNSPTGDFMLTQCHYRTLGGYSFSILVRGFCPLSVSINPETGQVKTK
ncbi:MAG: hypothetical protein KKF85_14290 [Gammaproteobacteria bacterium]|nr:hypothetical protein [Rhodocyclaceae bacterium]MBU3909612.1 hypothetical protein [Gammaproteobacteria bacterium]MBU3989674.1 hypothetical protein [Gammaproteobacteria bacterium]MBU4005145.1 hypothetical protein [Gammaproteobacteria bacterium]MBU4022324.1 hypothetical protein [Gammaproteobacteria bacterium]